MSRRGKASNNGYADLSGRRKSRTYHVDTSIGKVLLRRLNLPEALALRGSLIDIAGMAVEVGKDGERTIDEHEQEQQTQRIHKLLTAVIVKPVVHEDPEDGDTVADFPFQDQIRLFNAVMDSLGASPEKGKAVLP